MIINLTENNTISAVGNYRIISFSAPFKGVNAVGYSDVISGVPVQTSPEPGYFLKREWRWSEDGIAWSLWEAFTVPVSPLFPALAGKTQFWIEFKYTIDSNPAALNPVVPGTKISPIVVISQIDFMINEILNPTIVWTQPQSRCSAERSLNPALMQQATFNPYAVNKATQMAEQLSAGVAKMFGHDVNYFRVIPQDRSRDVVFMEWTIMHAQAPKCFKILVPNNQFPDSKMNYNPFGAAFDIPFEVHIDRTEWESTFGKNTMPQEGDFLYMPITNRMYEIQSSYAFRDFMQVPIYYKVLLIKYENRASVIKDQATQQMLDAATISVEQMFGDEIKTQEIDTTKPQQYQPSTSFSDPTRSYVAKQLSVIKYNIYNNWNMVADNYYNMKGMYDETGRVEPAVLYHTEGTLDATESRSVMLWVAPIADTYSVRTLISCEDAATRGWRIDLNYATSVGGCSINLTYNGISYLFPMPGVQLAEEQWYGIVVNFSPKFKQCSVGVYRTQVGKPDLETLFSGVKPFTDTACTVAAKLGLLSGKHLITNIRMFNEMIEQEHEALILTQNVVADASKALVIDNARQILRLAKVGKP